MFLTDPNVAIEAGLLLRAVMYALLFAGMGVVVWQAQDSPFGPNINRTFIKFLSVICFIVAALNVFMAFEWLFLYFM